MLPLLNIAVRAARNAGNVIIRSLQHVEHLEITTKGLNDFVSDIDRLAEREIIGVILKVYPNHAIMAEESGNSGDSDTVWIIDPLDGTTNFLHAFPHYCISIAIMIKGKLEHGVVYDPLREELFTASRGYGAQLNNRRIRVGKRKKLTNSLLATGFPFKNPQYLSPFLATFSSLFLQVADIRRTGSAALDLAYVAAGRLDGYWEIGLRKWDLAAGALLIEEAGGVISDFIGGNNYIDHGNVIVGNPNIHRQILADITPHLIDDLKK